jgi:hypothetical protein
MQSKITNVKRILKSVRRAIRK